MAILYADRAPTIEPRNGHALMTVRSGDDDVQVILTFHALAGLLRAARNGVDDVCRETRDNVTDFPKRKKGRR